MIIGISGKAQHGKDTVVMNVQRLMETLHIRAVRIGFADGVKKEATERHHWNGLKDEAGRSLLQKIGADRRREDPAYWIRRLIETIRDDPECSTTVFLVPDVRYLNEATALRAAGGALWRVIRFNPDGTPFQNDLTPEQREHASETDLDAYVNWDYILTPSTLDENRTMTRHALESVGLL